MHTDCCRIFVLERSQIEEIINNINIDKLYIETAYFKFGSHIRVCSENKNSVDLFFKMMEEKAGLFFLQNSEITDYDLSAEDIAGTLLIKRKKSVVTAESCTGGLIAKKLTDRQGSSAYFWGSYVTYDNSAKIMLGVREDTLSDYGAVSNETVKEMAESALLKSTADIAVSVSGIAGPGGGSTKKPVGTVCFGIRDAEKGNVLKILFSGCRETVREKASETALLIIIKKLLGSSGVDSIISGDYI